MVNGPQPHTPLSLKRQTSHVHCAPHIHREVNSSPITGDQIEWICEIPAPQNRTHNTQLINNPPQRMPQKPRSSIYARNFIPTKSLDYQFFEIPRNIITRNFLRIRYVYIVKDIEGIRMCDCLSVNWHLSHPLILFINGL